MPFYTYNSKNFLLLLAGLLNLEQLASSEPIKKMPKGAPVVTTKATWQRFNPSWNTQQHATFFDFFEEQIKIPHVVAWLIGGYAYTKEHFVHDTLLTDKISSIMSMIALNEHELAIGTLHGNISIFNKKKKEVTRTFQAHPVNTGLQGTKMLALLPNGFLASAAKNDETIRIWDLTAGTCVRTVTDLGYITALMALPSGDLVSGSQHGSVTTWNMQTGRGGLNCHYYTQNNSSGADALGKTSDSIIAIYFSRIAIDNLEGVKSYDYYHWRPDALTLPDGIFVSSSNAGPAVVRFWDLTLGKQSHKISIKERPLKLAYLAGTNQLLVGCEKGAIVVIDIATKERVQTLTIPQAKDITGIIALSDGQFIASYDIKVKNYNMPNSRISLFRSEVVSVPSQEDSSQKDTSCIVS